jgi:hypothetical protein
LKYFTYDQLLRFNRSSVKAGKNRNFNWRRVNKQVKVLARELNREKEEIVFPVVMALIHNDKEMRTQIAFGEDALWLDISFKQFAQLQDADNGEETQVVKSGY